MDVGAEESASPSSASAGADPSATATTPSTTAAVSVVPSNVAAHGVGIGGFRVGLVGVVGGMAALGMCWF